jgi:hypothetical protein
METTQEHVTHLTQETAIEVSTGKLAARLEELEKAQRRADRERLEWEMALQLADDAMYAGAILEGSAEEEHRLATIDLNTLQERIDRLLAADAREGWAWSSSKGALRVARARLEAMSERQVDAYLKLQICRKHRQLQRRILDQSAAALARAEQRKTVIGEEVGVLRNELGRHWEWRQG